VVAPRVPIFQLQISFVSAQSAVQVHTSHSRIALVYQLGHSFASRSRMTKPHRTGRSCRVDCVGRDFDIPRMLALEPLEDADSVLGYTSHADRGANGIAFYQSRNHLCLFV
jgi:hypothetical protein